ncbi:MAG: multiheme c-type cytochrome, partial [Planctomycetaceae bacterium]
MAVGLMNRRKSTVIVGVAALAILAGALIVDWVVALPPGLNAEYVGRQSCAQCHQRETDRWQGSDHDLAMDLATDEFVLGNFDGTRLEHHGVTSKMSHAAGSYFVDTEGTTGEATRFQVKYVFGYWPLQQYLAEVEPGQLQVLPVTWDVEKQRWYYASPDAPFGPGDPLHWTGSAQNWNHMCADCHSTNFEKNYHIESGKHHPTYSEMDVSCEACHGPGSLHVKIATSGGAFWDRRYGFGLPNLKGEDPLPQLESCAPCHAHRRRVYPGFQPGKPFLDHYDLTLLEDNLYHADGQIDEEVYVYGSFTQSLMYRKGVRCTDCHDPHTTRVKSGGNALCTQCHKPDKFDRPSHHHHQIGSKGSLCVECHMPSKKYMVVDGRRDHSLRIPRPDLTVEFGAPNACNNCHTKPKETPQWAADQIVKWYGPQRKYDPHYGQVIAAGRRGQPDALRRLADLAAGEHAGPIVRATAVSLLARRYSGGARDSAIHAALKDRDGLVRAAAVRGFENPASEDRRQAESILRYLRPLLDDPLRLVRTEAARVLAALPRQYMTASAVTALNRCLDEYRLGLTTNGDRSGSHMSLGVLHMQAGETDQAVDEFRL